MIAAVAAIQPSTIHGPSRPNTVSRRCKNTKPTGMTSSVSTVEVTSPPITTVANGGQISFSCPVTRASGHRPATVVAAVINTGRARSRTAASAAAPAERPPCQACCCMRSTSRIAGLTVIPIRASVPINAIGDSGIPAKSRAQVAPRIVNGNASRTSSGSVSDSNVTASTANSNSSTGSRIARNQLKFSSSPVVSRV